LATQYRYQFQQVIFNEAKQELVLGGLIVEIDRQPLQILALLLARGGQVVTRKEFFEKLWRGRPTAEAENALAKAIKKLRKALGAEAGALIENVPRVGYRFGGQVERASVTQPLGNRSGSAKGQQAGNPLSSAIASDGASEEAYRRSYSVFISYGSPDELFARRLNESLARSGIRTFFFPNSAQPGQKLHRVMREGINKYDRVILVCSRHSLNRTGVLNEIEETLQREAREGGQAFLIPITIDDYIFDLWRPERMDIAVALRDRVIADFRGAQNDAATFDNALRRLLAALVLADHLAAETGTGRISDAAPDARAIYGDQTTGHDSASAGPQYDREIKVEQALLESEAVLRAVTESTPDWLFLVDQSLRVQFMNRPLGPRRPEDVIGSSLLDSFPAAHRSNLGELYRGVLSTGEPARLELQYPGPDNKLSHYEHRVVPVIQSGVVRSLTVAVTDVTERKRAERALRETQVTLQTVAASTADWLALFDRQQQCVFLNRALHGVPPEGWIGASVEDFAPPADRAYMREIFEHIMNTGEPRDFDQVIMDAKRGPRYLELRARAVQADGRIFGAVVNITDVTERHAQQDALRTQARILETMREGVVLIDSTTHLITLTNATFDEMFGYSALELLGRSSDPLFSLRELQRERFERTLRDSSEALEVMPVELECSRKDGSRFLATCVITPLRISGQERWLALLNDVTDRKRR
jgi:PAS domain S-box-containing protein